jgi:hypothetical protein
MARKQQVQENGGSLYIDDGRPTAAAIGATMRNPREIARPALSPQRSPRQLAAASWRGSRVSCASS